MFFKSKKSKRCNNCNSSVEKKFSFCPYCGTSLADREREAKDFGLLGKEDSVENASPVQEGFGITDRLLNSMINSVMKSLEKQIRESERTNRNNLDNAEIQQFPNGIKIKIGMPNQNQMSKASKPQKNQQKQITDEQLNRMSSLPRTQAKTNIKRLGNKLVYELSTPGIASPEDVLISKLESGYEIKAIGKRKVYVNSIPVTLPMKGFSITDKKLLVEFSDK